MLLRIARSVRTSVRHGHLGASVFVPSATSLFPSFNAPRMSGVRFFNPNQSEVSLTPFKSVKVVANQFADGSNLAQ